MPLPLPLAAQSERQVEEEEFAVIVKAARCKTVQRLAAEDNALKTGADALQRVTQSAHGSADHLRTRCG